MMYMDRKCHYSKMKKIKPQYLSTQYITQNHWNLGLPFKTLDLWTKTLKYTQNYDYKPIHN
jgi:hypothetical protein